MRKRPIIMAPAPVPPSPTDVRAASFFEDQASAPNSFLGKYYRPNRGMTTQSQAPAVAAGGGGTPKAPIVTEAQSTTGDGKMGQVGYEVGRNIYTSGTQAGQASTTRVTDPNAPAMNRTGKTSVSTSIRGPAQTTLKKQATVSPRMVSSSDARQGQSKKTVSVSVSKSAPSDSVKKSGGTGGKKK